MFGREKEEGGVLKVSVALVKKKFKKEDRKKKKKIMKSSWESNEAEIMRQ